MKKLSLLVFAVLFAASSSFAKEQPKRLVKVGCPTANIEQYRKLAVLAKAFGATHLAADQIEPSMWQWNIDRKDPYPNWSIERPTIFKFIVPKELKGYIPEDYANRNLNTLKERMKILKEFGYKTTFNGMTPEYLPEAVYRKHPAWRGPRCDHPRRARKEYYAPCLDNPEVRKMYVEAIAELCRIAPFDSFELMTNDSGGGLCWYPKLYPGPNGPTACYFVPMAHRVVNLLTMFQEGAQKAGLKDVKVNLSRYFTREMLENALPLLKKNQYLMGKSATGSVERKVIGYMSVHREHTFPMNCMTRMVQIATQLQSAQATPEQDLHIMFRGLDEYDTIEFLKKYLNKKIAPGRAGVYNVLTDFAADLVGKEQAHKLVTVWDDVEKVHDALEAFETGGHLFTLGTVHQRWMTRPLVMFPNELKPEEKDYYRQFQFQAQTEADADNMIDLQGYRWLSGYSTVFLMQRLYYNQIASRLDRGAKTLMSLKPYAKNKDVADYLEIQSKKLRLYNCIARNAFNVIRYQYILDNTDYKRVPKDTTLVAREQGDVELYNLEGIMRNEINNTLEMIELISSTEKPLLQHAKSDEFESCMILGTREKVLSDLRKKVDIMENHRRDPERLYRSYNK